MEELTDAQLASLKKLFGSKSNLSNLERLAGIALFIAECFVDEELLSRSANKPAAALAALKKRGRSDA